MLQSGPLQIPWQSVGSGIPCDTFGIGLVSLDVAPSAVPPEMQSMVQNALLKLQAIGGVPVRCADDQASWGCSNGGMPSAEEPEGPRHFQTPPFKSSP